MTDYIVAVLFLVFFISGWQRGLIRSIMGPVSLILGSIAGYLYYQKDGDLFVALGISIIGPFLLNILLHLVLKAINFKKDDSHHFAVGRLLGGFFCVAWSGALVLMTLIVLMITPGDFAKLKTIKKDISESRTYELIRKFTDQKVSSLENIDKISDILSDPEKIEKIQQMREFRVLAKDEKVQTLIADDILVGQIQNKDYTKALRNPKMQAILRDQTLLKKLFAMQQKLIEEVSAPIEEGAAQADEPVTP